MRPPRLTWHCRSGSCGSSAQATRASRPDSSPASRPFLGAFDSAGFVDELVSRRIQLTQLVPTLIQAVTREVSSRAEPPDLSHLTEVVYGASPIRPDLLARAVAVLGCRFRRNYASSESGPLPITSLPPEDHDPARGRPGTAGRPSLGWEVRLGERGDRRHGRLGAAAQRDRQGAPGHAA